jgi:uncharacterized protein YcfJ
MAIGLAAALVVASIAGAAAFVNHDEKSPVVASTTKTKTVHAATAKKDLPWLESNKGNKKLAPGPQVAAAQPACNDSNILGIVAGGVAGGVLGSTVGRGNGRTAATIAGTAGGAYLGNQFIPLQNVTCR